ncbi:MAG: HD-GYP domain-containing protein [Planctomycetota bacterium]
MNDLSSQSGSGSKPPATDESSRVQTEALLDDIERLSLSLSDKFEEVRLIHDLTSQLELDDEPSQICRELLGQLHVCVSSRSIVIELAQLDECPNRQATVQSVGEPVDKADLDAILRDVFRNADASDCETRVVNHSDLPALKRRRVVVLPISRRGERLGRLIALRDQSQEEYGTIEIDLMRSVLTVLAMHLVNQRQYSDMQAMLEGTVRSLASALDAKDAYTHGHSSRVAALSVFLARALGLGREECETLHLAGVLHDIGKIGVDDSVLKKPGKLTEEEFDQIKQHPVIGYEILKDIKPFRSILPVVRHHHESWDGRGYPDGLVGNEIPRHAQIVAVADAFDAMVSDRPYREGMPLERVMSVFRQGRGSQWAADVVDCLLQHEVSVRGFALKETSAR